MRILGAMIAGAVAITLACIAGFVLVILPTPHFLVAVIPGYLSFSIARLACEISAGRRAEEV
jgi:hypothetical protein